MHENQTVSDGDRFVITTSYRDAKAVRLTMDARGRFYLMRARDDFDGRRGEWHEIDPPDGVELPHEIDGDVNCAVGRAMRWMQENWQYVVTDRGCIGCGGFHFKPHNVSLLFRVCQDCRRVNLR